MFKLLNKSTSLTVQVSGDEIIGLNDRQHRLQGKKRRDRHNSIGNKIVASSVCIYVAIFVLAYWLKKTRC